MQKVYRSRAQHRVGNHEERVEQVSADVYDVGGSFEDQRPVKDCDYDAPSSRHGVNYPESLVIPLHRLPRVAGFSGKIHFDVLGRALKFRATRLDVLRGCVFAGGSMYQYVAQSECRGKDQVKSDDSEAPVGQINEPFFLCSVVKAWVDQQCEAVQSKDDAIDQHEYPREPLKGKSQRDSEERRLISTTYGLFPRFRFDRIVIRRAQTRNYCRIKTALNSLVAEARASQPAATCNPGTGKSSFLWSAQFGSCFSCTLNRFNPYTPSSNQLVSPSVSPAHSMKNLDFQRLLRWNMIMLPLLTTSSWENVLSLDFDGNAVRTWNFIQATSY